MCVVHHRTVTRFVVSIQTCFNTQIGIHRQILGPHTRLPGTVGLNIGRYRNGLFNHLRCDGVLGRIIRCRWYGGLLVITRREVHVADGQRDLVAHTVLAIDLTADPHALVVAVLLRRDFIVEIARFGRCG